MLMALNGYGVVVMTETVRLYDVLYQLRDDEHIGRHAKSFKTEAAARRFCSNLGSFPAGTIHYAITCEDGRTVHNTQVDGLVPPQDPGIRTRNYL
jgi:hypothetical protein